MVAAFCNQNYSANQGKSYLSSENDNQYLFKPLTVSNLHPITCGCFQLPILVLKLEKKLPISWKLVCTTYSFNSSITYLLPVYDKTPHARRNYKEAATWPPAQPPQPSLVSALPPPGLFVSAWLY